MKMRVCERDKRQMRVKVNDQLDAFHLISFHLIFYWACSLIGMLYTSIVAFVW